MLGLVVIILVLIVFVSAESIDDDATLYDSAPDEVTETTDQAAVTTTTSIDPSAAPSAPASTIAPTTSPEWVQISEESFSGNSLKDSWGVYDGAGTSGVGVRKPSAVSVQHGVLSINGNGNTVGGMSQDDVSQTYGRWAIRAKQDVGQGFTPAILLWPDSEDWPIDGEIDIAEIHGRDRVELTSTVHYGEDNLQLGQSLAGDFTQWHTFMVDWLPDRIVFYVDGVAHFTVTDPAAIPKGPMHLALQLDTGVCGSQWIGCPDASTPANVGLHVDWVKVYERAS